MVDSISFPFYRSPTLNNKPWRISGQPSSGQGAGRRPSIVTCGLGEARWLVRSSIAQKHLVWVDFSCVLVCPGAVGPGPWSRAGAAGPRPWGPGPDRARGRFVCPRRASENKAVVYKHRVRSSSTLGSGAACPSWKAVQHSIGLSHSLNFSDRHRNTPTSVQNRSESLCAGVWVPCRIFWAWFGPA